MSTNRRTPTVTVAECLETFEDATFTKKSRTNDFQSLNIILQDKESSEKVTSEEVLRILAVFEKCLKLDIQSIPHALTTVLSLLRNEKVISNIPAPDLLRSALAVLQMLKTLCALETQHLRIMGVEVLLSYPNDVLTLIIRHNCSEVLEIFDGFTPQILQGGSKTLQNFLSGILMKLPPQEKTQFIQEGLPIWFNIITVVMKVWPTVKEDDRILVCYIECVEQLTEAMLLVDYTQCPQWHDILTCICDTKTYPTTILRQLQRNSNEWHRFWIVLVKLLKTQITRVYRTHGTPIQPMLEAVETAFKMDPQNRSRAFQCWDTLIDSLSADTNSKCTPRYLKLLLIPLKPNNAKTEDTARAKFHTWWNLIRKFHAKFDTLNSTNEVLFEFLHFMFGKKIYDKDRVSYRFVSGASQAYNSIKSLCLQAFAEIVGHGGNCNCSMNLPKLNEKILINKLFASHWDEWMSALKTAIIVTNTMYKTDKDKIINEPLEVLCVWTTFVISIAELPPNGVRIDMINELILMLTDLLQICNTTDALPYILFSLALSLFEDNESIKELLVACKGDDPLLLCKVVSIILNPKIYGVFERYETMKMVDILKPVTYLAVDSLNTTCILDCLTFSSSSIKFWTALAHSMSEANKFCDLNMLKQMLIWPVLALQKIDVDNHAATEWQALYNIYTKSSSKTDIDRDIFEQLEVVRNNSYFKVIVAICISKNRMLYLDEDVAEYSRMLENVTEEMITMYEVYKQAFPMLVDTIVMMLDRASSASEEKNAKISFNCVKIVLLMLFSQIQSKEKEADNVIDVDIIIMLDNIFRAVQPMNKIPLYSQFFCGFLEHLREYAISLNKESSLFKLILSKVNYLRVNCPIDIVKTRINECIEMLTGNSNKIVSDTSRNTSKTVKVFTSPNVNKVVKRSKKKEAVIVNTVTENGEEYAVVKSNWKFNPKKLTENQREKLQRKREDIPALYQDLSQSQDEFKLSKWKTDSQDTTTSSNSKSSKLTTNDDTINILKNIESSEVVPNIMQNILSENDNHTNSLKEPYTGRVLKTDKSDKVKQSSPSTAKIAKSPRMALKDRVFRNVRNLIEKSSPKNDTADTVIDESQLIKTPPAKPSNNANLINSAPPLITTDRPSRVKRIPRKFDDAQLFGLKKRRYSLTDSQPQSDENEILNEDGNCKAIDKTKTILTNNTATITQQELQCSNPDNIQHRHSDVTEVKGAERVHNARELVNIPVSQHDRTEGVSDNISTEKFCGIENNEHASDIQKNVIALNSHNNNKYDKHQNKDKEPIVDSQDLRKNHEVQLSPKGDGVDQIIKESDDCQRNREVQDVQMICPAQDGHKNELKDDITDVKDTVDLNSETNKLEILQTPVRKTKQASQKSTAKKTNTKRSRIEKELAIDMVEGHPYLKVQSEKRLTRKKLLESENVSRRKSVPLKPNKTKAQKKSPKSKQKESTSNSQSCAVTVEETQERNTLPEDAPCSEDVIESSQDSDFTTITVKSTTRTPKRHVVSIQRLEEVDVNITRTQDLLQDSDCEMLCVSNKSINQETKDDIELPQNKTADDDKNQSELTENMDTETAIEEKFNDDVIIIDDRDTPIAVNCEKSLGSETQELAEADTQPNDLEDSESSETHQEIQNTPMDITETMSSSKLNIITAESQDVIEISTEPNCSDKDSDICSPFKDDTQRKQDFLNNTSEISPIKVQSPDKDKPSPEKDEETSSDYLVVKLSSPVHSNGEPFSSKGSPEFFTDDKTSPDKRDQSPPRAEVIASSGSPSTTLSLKKNRPQTLRPGGRAAHMIGLCVPDSKNSKKNPEQAELEDTKKPNTSTPARRNLRVLYNVENDNSDVLEDNEKDNFLKLKKALPSVDSSPAVPILKRKIDIIDDTTASPASKRKRVSFHDPPVSTTVSVQKYIKPDCIESPITIQKRQESQVTRSSSKSPKRLENTFKLDTVLSKAVESFKEPDSLITDTNTSLDITPAVEVVITSELNDNDPICSDLVDCKDSIENIAVELSSPAMKDLFIKELDGKVLTVGDLAKMTELEVNRLCIKAPKVQVTKKVLAGYVSKKVLHQNVPSKATILVDETAIAMEMNEDMAESSAASTTVETQTDEVSMCETASQTKTELVNFASTQTTSVSTADTNTQTLESGYKTTSDIITSCLLEREDFIENVGKHLPSDTMIDLLVNKSDASTSTLVLTKYLDRQSQNLPNDKRNSRELSLLKDFLLGRFHHRDLILFCSRLFQGLYDKSA